MSRKVKMVVHPLAIALILVAVGFGLSSCNRNKIYENYKDYGNGYETAKKGESKPSLWSSDAEKEGYEAGLNDLRSGTKSPIVEFQYTEEEIKSLENRWPTFEKVLEDAIRGDRDAIFAIGLCYLYGGKGLPIDVTKANMFFGKAASLGHAPSLDKIRAMYLEDNPNPFLHLVYVNLAIAMGHTEYTIQYHHLRSDMMEKFGERGKSLVKEIERISQEKLEVIFENLEKLKQNKKSKNTDFGFFKINDITFADSLYDLPHWLSIAGISTNDMEKR